MKYVFIDAEYAYTCSAREGQLPNYKNIMELFNSDEEKVVLVYHVGAQDKKRGVCDFLTRLGVDYNIILEHDHASKTQLVAATMGIDVMKYFQKSKDASFYFLTGDDYLIPIINELINYELQINIFYFPAIYSIELKYVLDRYNIKPKALSNRYFTYPRMKDGR